MSLLQTEWEPLPEPALGELFQELHDMDCGELVQPMAGAPKSEAVSIAPRTEATSSDAVLQPPPFEKVVAQAKHWAPTAADKKEQRRARNRLVAKQCRERRRAEILQTKRRLELLETENDVLKRELKNLQRYTRYLETRVAQVQQ